MRLSPRLLAASVAAASLGAQPPVPAEESSEEHEKAIATARAGDFEPALILLDPLIEKAPDDVVLRRWRGHCRNALGRHAQALKDYDRAIALDAAHAWSWYARGMAKHHLDRFEEAIADYSRSIVLDPLSHKAWEWRAYNRLLAGDPLGAWLDLREAVDLDGQNPWVHLMLGRAATQLGDDARALASLRRADKLTPESDVMFRAEVLCRSGFVKARAGSIEAALEAFDAAVDLDPECDEHARLLRFGLARGLGRMADPKSLPDEEWTGRLASIWRRKVAAQDLLAEAAAVESEAEKRVRRCEAALHLALRARVDGPADPALRRLLLESVAHGDRSLPEWWIARGLLRGTR